MKMMNIPEIKKKRFLYIGLCLVIFGWLMYGVLLLLEKNTSKVLSTNNAKVVAVVSDVRSLTEPKDIQYGNTSSNLSELITKYQATSSSIAAVKLDSITIVSSMPTSVSEVKNINTSVNNEIDTIEQTLNKTSSILIVLQKFLEYDPATDLQPYATGSEADASERLSRTQEGMKSITSALSSESWYYKKDVIDLITPLSKKVITLTPDQVTQWNNEVNATQKKIIDIIQTEYNQNINQSLNKLEEYSPIYLSL